MVDYEQELTNLDDSLLRLRVEYDVYFNGSRKRPPEDLKLRVEKLVRRLSEASDMSIAERFRYNTLVTRFYVYKDRWRRAERNLDQGKAAPKPAPVPATAAAAQAPAASQPGSLRISIANPQVEEDKVRQLFDSLVCMRGKHASGPINISFQQFKQYISSQTQTIRAKYKCSKVEFKVSLEQDAVRFTAKADDRS